MPTNNNQYSLINRIRELEEKLRKVERRSTLIPGVQVLRNGQVYFPGGVRVGAGNTLISTPAEMPAAQALSLSSSASFDSINVTATWLAPTGFGAEQLTQYIVRLNKSATTETVETTVGRDTNNATFTGLEPNTPYIVTVYAQTHTGKLSAPVSGDITSTIDNVAPAAPSNVDAHAGLKSILISWDENIERDMRYGAGFYRIRVSENSDLSSPVVDLRISGTSFNAAELNPALEYYVGISAIDSSGNESSTTSPTSQPFKPLQVVTKDIAFEIGGANIFKNSSFEDSTPFDNWNTSDPSLVGFSIEPTGGVKNEYGTAAACIISADGQISQTLPLSVGKYTLSFWSKADNIVSAGGVGIAARLTTTSGVIENVEKIEGPGTLDGNVLTLGTGTWDWTKSVITFEITNQNGTFNIFFHKSYGGGSSGVAYFDLMQLERGDVATSYAPRPDEIASNKIVAGMIAANTVGANHIAANTINGDKMAATTSITVGKVINSANYVAGSTGWKINGNGDAEFNSVTIRGILASAQFVSSSFDFKHPNNSVAMRITSDGSSTWLNLGQGSVNNNSSLGWNAAGNRWEFIGFTNAHNAPAFKFSNGYCEFDNPRSTGGFSTLPWQNGGIQGYFIGKDDVPPGAAGWDPNFGLQLLKDNSWYKVFTQGWLDSEFRRVGFKNTMNGDEQVYIDFYGSTRSLTRTGWITYSDEHLKQNIKELPGTKKEKIKHRVKQLTPVSYEYKTKKLTKEQRDRARIETSITDNVTDAPVPKYFGFTAQQMREVFPEVVHEIHDAEGTKLGIAYDSLIAVLVQNNQEQQDEIDLLEKRIDTLENR